MQPAETSPPLQVAPLPSDEAELARRYAWPQRSHPVLRANMVTSLDGRATVSGNSGGLSSPADQRLLAVLRATADVLLVGAGTVRAEGYERIGDDLERRARLRPGPPVRLAVVSARGLPDGLPALATAQGTPLLVTGEAGAAVSRVPGAEVLVLGSAGPDLAALPAALAERGLHRVLCEGGPRLLADLLALDLVDDLCLTTSPVVAGAGTPVFPGPAAGSWTLRSVAVDADHLFTRYQRSGSR